MSTVTSNGYQRLQSGFWFKISDNSGPYASPDGVTFTSAAGGATSLASAAQAAVGIVAKAEPFGGLEVTGGTTTLLADAFDSVLDTTNTWAVSGTVLPANASGGCVASLGAVNSASSVLVSQPSFRPLFQHYVLGGQISLGAAQVNPNAHRFFGMGLVTSYASATPLTNGHGLEVDLTGAMNLVVYINGTRYVVNSTNPALITAPGSWATDMVMSNYGQTLTWPASGTAILFMRFVGPVIYYYLANTVGGLDVPVGVANYVPAQLVLPLRLANITTPAVSTVLATTLSLSGLLFGTAGGSNFTNSDPVYPWRQQTIDALGRAACIVPELTSTGSITTQNLVPGGVATAGSAVSLATNGLTNVMLQVTGVYVGALSLQVTVDNVNWITVGGTPLFNVNTGTAAASIASALDSIFQCSNVAGAIGVRITALGAQTGTAVVTMRACAS